MLLKTESKSKWIVWSYSIQSAECGLIQMETMDPELGKIKLAHLNANVHGSEMARG